MRLPDLFVVQVTEPVVLKNVPTDILSSNLFVVAVPVENK